MKHKTCPLCGANGKSFYSDPKHLFFSCERCMGLFRDPRQWPDHQSEEKRYLLHQNHLEDMGYRSFVEPILERVRTRFDPDSSGLDYGCGHSPVISEILRREGFSVDDYDPFFYPSKIFEGRTYDFIICCEVIEHFHRPDDEFERLKRLLNKNGSLICMTDIYSDDTNFNNWYYKNDPTHVFIYREQTLNYLSSKNDFTRVDIQGRLIEFFN